MACDTLSNNLGKTEEVNNNITGISITPKRNYCIIRIWLNTKNFITIDNYNLIIPSYSTLMYKSHLDCI